jgi:opacity protein-like surface antigen
MRKLIVTAAAAAALSAAALAPTAAQAGCYRMGLTGYHWYYSCFGPGFIYPHHRACNRNGFCWYH